MPSPRLAIAAGNKLGAEAAANVARAGGNAVDACLASAIMAWVAEPSLASLGGSGFIAICAPDGTHEVIDGNAAMPYTSPEYSGQGLERVYFPDYSDGMWTGIGPGSIAIPGVLEGVHAAWTRHGRIEWEALFEDAIRAAREGIPFALTSAYYISTTWDQLWSRYSSARALFEHDGAILKAGDRLVQSDLADSLETIAREGPDVFYGGDIGAQIVSEIAGEGGFLRLDDLRAYRAEIRRPIATHAFGWNVESNPPPAVGGAVLTHMLALMEGADLGDPVQRLKTIVASQRAATGYRKRHYNEPEDIAGALDAELARLQRGLQSPSTTHTSAADADGFVCAFTESAGYSSGLIAAGVLLNNTLGEEELNPLGIHRLSPGSRCHSNMAPTIVTGPHRVVGLGSPGADRIVGAIAQTLVRLAVDDDSLADAIAAPRAHLDQRQQGETLCYEPGLPGDRLDYLQRPYEELHMYFGGVQGASVDETGAVDAAHDPRRSGASALV
ncbi:MAG: gamma-glutamyltransferase [Actinomycetota bacterium]